MTKYAHQLGDLDLALSRANGESWEDHKAGQHSTAPRYLPATSTAVTKRAGSTPSWAVPPPLRAWIARTTATSPA
ncbi:hypothetical protein G6F65_018563 [Rhizopus arrhizus]|nr:hypothetical protein G6F65_018563 [Rhizopus arrhizus]